MADIAARDRAFQRPCTGSHASINKPRAKDASRCGTDTKAAKTRAEPEILSWWTETFVVPCVAIGGITVENAAPLVRAGADFLAVSSGVWAHSEGPAAAVRALNRILSEEQRNI